jgi:raffinose/stachyose/melibiose transport system permease protein
MKGHKYTLRTLAREIMMVIAAAAYGGPFYMLVVMSLQSKEGVQHTPFAPPISDPHWENFSTAWTTGGAAGGMGAAFLDTVIITLGSVITLVIVSALCGYVLARRSSRLSNALYLLFVLGLAIPGSLALIPLYVVMRDLGLLGTYQGMILLNTAILTPFAVFLYTGFIRALPREFEEAAQMDGAGLVGTVFRVVLPLLRPITATVAMLAGLIVWNEYFLALVFLAGSPIANLPLQLNAFVNDYYTDWNLVMAGAAICIIPVLIVFLALQKQFMKGFAGGIRG